MKTERGEILADKVIRQTLRPKASLQTYTKRSMSDLRAAMLNARKFVLDEKMSAFLADLSMTPFKAAGVRRDAVLDSLRHSAMLPFPKTWIEFNGQMFKKRMIELEARFVNVQSGDGHYIAPDPEGRDVPETWGWLLEEHPKLSNAIQMQEFFDESEIGGIGIATLPLRWAWNIKDEPIPWAGSDAKSGMLAHGIVGYVCEQIGVILDEPLEPEFTRRCEIGNVAPFSTHLMVAEMGGVVRYALAFLATLSDIPALITEVKPQRGYFARGNYRKFVEHRVMRLTIPQRTNVKMLAKRLIAIARRKGHEVRAHWRVYQRGAEGLLCNPGTHEWGALRDDGHAPCLRCPAWRTLIPKHERGDSRLGFVTHDYSVGKGEIHP